MSNYNSQSILYPESTETEILEALSHKIGQRQAVVSVIGLGYVGLPLATAFAQAGFQVIGIDVNQSRVESINRGVSYVEDVPTETLVGVTANSPGATKSSSSGRHAPGMGRLLATTDHRYLDDADAAIVCANALEQDQGP